MTINLVKLATELAHTSLELTYGEDETSYYCIEDECMKYKEDYQNLFDSLYDEFYYILESNNLKHENK